MKKLRQYLDLWEAGKSVRGLNVTMADIRDLQDAYNAILRKQLFTFLSANVKKVLDMCGIATIDYGIGWGIFPDGGKEQP